MTQRETARARWENGRLGDKALAKKIQGIPGRPCTITGYSFAFNLTFDETPTQDPGDVPDESASSDDDDSTLPPKPPTDTGN